MASLRPAGSRPLLLMAILVVVVAHCGEDSVTKQTGKEVLHTDESAVKPVLSEGSHEARMRAAGHSVPMESLMGEASELQSLGDDNYYGEYTYKRESKEDSALAMLQVSEGRDSYPWLISQEEAQKRARSLSKQKKEASALKEKLHQHDVPLKDTMSGPGISQRVSQEMEQFEAAHPAPKHQSDVRSHESAVDRAEDATMQQARELGDDDDGDDEMAQSHDSHHPEGESAWGDDDDDNDNDSPFGMQDDDDDLVLLQEAAGKGDMMSMLAKGLKHRQSQQRATEHRREKATTQRVDAPTRQDMDAQQSFTTQVNKQAASKGEDGAGSDMHKLLLSRHKLKPSGFKFVPKNKAAADRTKRVAREAHMQAQLARSFQLAMKAAQQKRERAAGHHSVHQTEAVRALFDATSGNSVRMGQKLQPGLKTRDDTWQSDVQLQQKMSKEAAQVRAQAVRTQRQAPEVHSMKELFPAGDKARAQSVDETGMDLKVHAVQHVVSAEAQRAKDMQKMMLSATLRTQKQAQDRFDSESERLGEQHGASGLIHSNHVPAKQGRAVQPVKGSVHEADEALHRAKAFLKSSQSKPAAKHEAGQQPEDRQGMLKLFKSGHAVHQTAEKPVVRAAVLGEEDAQQVRLQQEMLAHTQASSAQRAKALEQQGSTGDLASLFKASTHTAAAASQQVHSTLSSADQQALALQQAFTKQQQQQHSAAQSAAQSEAVEHSRSGLTQMFTGKARKALKGTHETLQRGKKLSDDFSKQKAMQQAVLTRMHKQQQQRQAEEEHATTASLGEDDVRQLFKVSTKSAAIHSKQWAAQQRSSNQQQQDQSSVLTDHSKPVQDSVVAPQLSAAPPSAPTKDALSLEQLGAGTSAPSQSLKEHFQAQMKSHFVSLLEKNKAKFNTMMAQQGAQGADDFYNNMKKDLQTILNPTAPKTAPVSTATTPKPAAAKPVAVAPKPTATAAMAPKPKAVAPKIKASSLIQEKAGPVQHKAAPKATTKPAGMDLASLEHAVDALSPEDKRKFIMHRLAKLAQN
eukprot:TRINITY_DN175_c0_g1_i1.p1 TRINITY_DN175_c0_g1~~TRINITY_DN175_c0_g1_i1.p1  ORF type:complete len:1026 (-),score=436.95 TRINITY_DN175_c0_g1_i1:152-3229(-)